MGWVLFLLYYLRFATCIPGSSSFPEDHPNRDGRMSESPSPERLGAGRGGGDQSVVACPRSQCRSPLGAPVWVHHGAPEP